VSLSGADEQMGMSVDRLRERYAPALAQLLPRARQAKLELFLATREHAATFRASPGVSALRPRSSTAVPGLALAGAWTQTGWPATLESAVLSGHAAARSVLAHVGARPSAGAAGGGQRGAPARDREGAGAGAPIAATASGSDNQPEAARS
jgi:uncharacterized protein with NAD-binding domain and iron-sulfur cluster